MTRGRRETNLAARTQDSPVGPAGACSAPVARRPSKRTLNSTTAGVVSRNTPKLNDGGVGTPFRTECTRVSLLQLLLLEST